MSRSVRWALVLAVVLLVIGACGPSSGCGTLVRVCDGTEHTIMAGVKDLSQEVRDDIRYFRFWDCAMEKWIQSSCSADCTLELR